MLLKNIFAIVVKGIARQFLNGYKGNIFFAEPPDRNVAFAFRSTYPVLPAYPVINCIILSTT